MIVNQRTTPIGFTVRLLSDTERDQFSLLLAVTGQSMIWTLMRLASFSPIRDSLPHAL
jgi:hypothetical protein